MWHVLLISGIRQKKLKLLSFLMIVNYLFWLIRCRISGKFFYFKRFVTHSQLRADFIWRLFLCCMRFVSSHYSVFRNAFQTVTECSLKMPCLVLYIRVCFPIPSRLCVMSMHSIGDTKHALFLLSCVRTSRAVNEYPDIRISDRSNESGF